MPLFYIHNLSISFKQNHVLKGVSFSIPSTGLHAIVGKSGCGKSTLLNLLFRLEKPSSGTIEFMSRNIAEFTDKEFSYYHAYEVSMVFQHYNLLSSFTAIENVIMPLLIRGESRSDSIKKANALFERFSLTQIKDQNVDTLSGGEKQRVAILRAIITSPKALLCDEPTGALDSENSLLVMSMFKEISKSIAVVFVSHNMDLVKKFADRIISLQNGTIISDSSNVLIKDKQVSKGAYRRKHKLNWNDIFVRKHIKKSKNKNILSIIATSFGFLTIFLCYGFSNGSKNSQENALLKNYSIGTSTVSLKSYYEVENSPLRFEKNVRPKIEDLEETFGDISYIDFETNFSYAFSSYPDGIFNKEKLPSFEMVPTLGLIDDFNTVFVNKEFADMLEKYSFKINDFFSITNSSSFSLPTGEIDNPFIKDEITYNLEFKIGSIVEEFSFLNSPKIYYSYEGLATYLKSIRLNNISLYKGKYISINRYIEECSDDDVASSYSLYAFVKDKNYYNQFFDLISDLKAKNNCLQIDSTAYEIKQSYSSFISSFSDALFIFVIIVFIAVNLIIGMLSLSSFLENKKESAILTCLGARNHSIISIYLKQNFVLLLMSFFIGIALSFPFQFLLNLLFQKYFGLSNLISIPFLKFQNIYLLLPLGVLTISIIILLIFVLTPLFFYRHISLTDELRDE